MVCVVRPEQASKWHFISSDLLFRTPSGQAIPPNIDGRMMTGYLSLPRLRPPSQRSLQSLNGPHLHLQATTTQCIFGNTCMVYMSNNYVPYVYTYICPHNNYRSTCLVVNCYRVIHVCLSCAWCGFGEGDYRMPYLGRGVHCTDTSQFCS